MTSALHTAPPPGPWMKDTTHYDGPVSPLCASAYLPRLEAGGGQMCAEYGMLLEEVRQAAINGEVYMQSAPPSSEDVVAARITAAAEALRSDRPGEAARRWQKGGWREEFAERIQALRTRDLRALDDAALDGHLQDCLDLLADGQVAHFQLVPAWLLAAHDLATVGEELLGWGLAETTELVAGLSEISAAPTRDLTELAAALRERPGGVEAVADWKPDEPLEGVLGRLREVDGALADRLVDHLDRYGCRVPGYDCGAPTLAEQPELALRLLHDLTVGEAEAVAPPERLAERRQQAVERARAVLAERGVGEQERARFEEALSAAQAVWGLREDNLLLTDAMPNALLRYAALEIGRRLAERGLLSTADDAVWLELDELRTALRAPDDASVPELAGRIAERRETAARVRANPGPPAHGEPPPPPQLDALPAEAARINGALLWLMGIEFGPPASTAAPAELRGHPASPGQVSATARIVHDEREFERLGPGEVLVCRLTTPAWTALFARAAAVVTETGSTLSHAAIVAREHAIPAVVGAASATEAIADGETVTVDGAAGVVTRSR